MQKAVVTLLILLSTVSVFSQPSRGVYHARQSRILFDQERYHDAERYADSAVLVFRQENNLDSLQRAYLLLYEIQRARKNHEKALVNFQVAMQLGDSIESMRQRIETETLLDSIHYLQEAGRIERIRLDAEMVRRMESELQTRSNTFFITGSLLALALIAVFIFYRRVRNVEAQLAETRKELGHLQAFREKLFTVLSYDLKHLLTSFENLSRGLSEQVQSMNKEESVQLLAHLRDTASELKDTVGNVVEWVALQANAKPFHPASFDCKALIEETVEKFQWRLNAKNLRADIFIPDHQNVFADREMVAIILENLLSNAVQFTPVGGTITCFSGKKDVLVTVGVKDTGQGIRTEDLEKLFNAREDFHAIGKPGHKGTGVGLLLARDLVERNGGRIYVESTIGQGSTFYFSLPESGH